MRYFFSMQLYWPIWLAIGGPAGILTGAVIALFVTMVLWRAEFGEWWFK